MIINTASHCIAHRLCVLPLIVLLLSSCLQEQPGGIEGTGGLNPPPPPQGGSSMTTARAEHTATLLRDGRVLIAGGFDGSLHALASAELYDPTSGTFARTGDMTAARGSHTASLLANGDVLIAGGQTETPRAFGIALDSAEIYDPSTGTFTATGKMISPFYGLGVSTSLPDGRVLIATDGFASSAEIYDPVSGSFMLTGAYASTSYWIYATALLPDGRVLVVGVVDSAGSAGTAQLFDPTANTFKSTGQRDCFDCLSTATLLPNGQVLFVEAGDGISDFAEIYDPASGTFLNSGRTLDSQMFPTATRLGDGTVLLAGGQLPGSATPATPPGNPTVQLYVPASGTFARAASLKTGRYSHTATLLPDGTVLIAGGYSAWQQPTAGAEIYK